MLLRAVWGRPRAENGPDISIRDTPSDRCVRRAPGAVGVVGTGALRGPTFVNGNLIFVASFLDSESTEEFR